VPLIAPSILAADFGRLSEEVKAVEEAGADWIHVDVMDGHFVPNITMGPDVVGALRRATTLPLDVHLMIEEPSRYVEAFAGAGADYISVHEEAVDDLDAAFTQIDKCGCKPGVAINPETQVETVSPFIREAALILVMSVNPGFGAQAFMPVALPKLELLAGLKKREQSPCLLEVDGGIKTDNVAKVLEAGADVVVAGSAVFGSGDYAATIAAMRRAA
jgi:ribulose-phosphate 3-epimerase